MNTRDFMRILGCVFVSGVIVVGFIYSAGYIVKPETLVGQMVVGFIVGVGLWIVWLTWGLVVADFQEAAQRDIDRAIKRIQRDDYRM